MKTGRVSVLKKGKWLMARGGEPRIFKSVEMARNFVINLIGVSKSLVPQDFQYIEDPD